MNTTPHTLRRPPSTLADTAASAPEPRPSGLADRWAWDALAALASPSRPWWRPAPRALLRELSVVLKPLGPLEHVLRRRHPDLVPVPVVRGHAPLRDRRSDAVWGDLSAAEPVMRQWEAVTAQDQTLAWTELRWSPHLTGTEFGERIREVGHADGTRFRGHVKHVFAGVWTRPSGQPFLGRVWAHSTIGPRRRTLAVVADIVAVHTLSGAPRTAAETPHRAHRRSPKRVAWTKTAVSRLAAGQSIPAIAGELGLDVRLVNRLLIEGGALPDPRRDAAPDSTADLAGSNRDDQ